MTTPHQQSETLLSRQQPESRGAALVIELKGARSVALRAMQQLAVVQAKADEFVGETGLNPDRGEYDNPPAHLATFMRVWRDMDATVSIQEIANDL